MMMYIASLIVTAKKWKQVTFPTIVNLLNRIYYNSIKDSHRVIKNEALKNEALSMFMDKK